MDPFNNTSLKVSASQTRLTLQDARIKINYLEFSFISALSTYIDYLLHCEHQKYS